MSEWLQFFGLQSWFSVGGIILGIVIVFVALVILISAIKLASRIVHSEDERKPAASDASAEPATGESSLNLAAGALDPQLVAVITAALMAMEQSGKRLVVRSIRRTTNWSDAGRREQMEY